MLVGLDLVSRQLGFGFPASKGRIGLRYVGKCTQLPPTSFDPDCRFQTPLVTFIIDAALGLQTIDMGQLTSAAWAILVSAQTGADTSGIYPAFVAHMLNV